MILTKMFMLKCGAETELLCVCVEGGGVFPQPQRPLNSGEETNRNSSVIHSLSKNVLSSAIDHASI